jgi:hypothetical protein
MLNIFWSKSGDTWSILRSSPGFFGKEITYRNHNMDSGGVLSIGSLLSYFNRKSWELSPVPLAKRNTNISKLNIRL